MGGKLGFGRQMKYSIHWGNLETEMRKGMTRKQCFYGSISFSP